MSTTAQSKAWRARNPEKVRAKNAAKLRRCKEWLDTFKNVPCHECRGVFPPLCLDFHHIDPSKKAFTISAKVRCTSRARVIEEIKKCVVICANCHRLVDHRELRNEPPKELVVQQLR